MKRRKQNKIIIIVISLLVSFILAWYILDSLLLSIAFSIFIILLVFKLFKLSTKDDIKYKNIESAYNFVNLLNVSMLSTNSVYEAYKSIENYVEEDFLNISNEDFFSQLKEIANEYDLNSFKMYINTLLIYDIDGGDFKQMNQIPSSLCQKCKVYYNKLKTNKRFKLLELTSLYVLWICVMCFVRFSLNEFYSLMMQNSLYQILIFIILISGSLFYYQSFSEYFNNKIRGM